MNPTSHLRLPARLLTLLVVVAAAILVATGAVGPAAAAAGTAPGPTASSVRIGVGAHSLADQLLVEVSDGIAAGQRRDNSVVAATTAVGSRVAPNTTRAPIRVNLGGEGEVAGAINVQPARIGGNVDAALENAKRVAAQSGQPVVMAEGNRLPFGRGSIDEVWTNNVPVGKGGGYFGPSFDPDEIFRILRPGGSWLGNSAQ